MQLYFLIFALIVNQLSISHAQIQSCASSTSATNYTVYCGVYGTIRVQLQTVRCTPLSYLDQISGFIDNNKVTGMRFRCSDGQLSPLFGYSTNTPWSIGSTNQTITYVNVKIGSYMDSITDFNGVRYGGGGGNAYLGRDSRYGCPLTGAQIEAAPVITSIAFIFSCPLCPDGKQQNLLKIGCEDCPFGSYKFGFNAEPCIIGLGPPVQIWPSFINILGGDVILIRPLGEVAGNKSAEAPKVKIDGRDCFARWTNEDRENVTCISPPGINGGMNVTIVFTLLSTSFGVISYKPPIVDKILPATGDCLGGNQITILGSQLGLEASQTRVRIGNFTCASIKFTNSTFISCTVPTGVGPGAQELVITVGNQRNVQKAWYFYNDPKIFKFFPMRGFDTNGGEILTIIGTNFGFNTSQCTGSSVSCFVPNIQINKRNCLSSVVLNDSAAICVTPRGVGGPLNVTFTINNISTSASNAFYYRLPVVEYISPSVSVTSGETVVIKCQNILGDESEVTVWFTDLGLSANRYACNDLRIDGNNFLRCTTPSNLLGAYYVSVEHAQQWSTEEIFYTVGGTTRTVPIVSNITIQTLQNEEVSFEFPLISNLTETVNFEIISLPISGRLFQYSASGVRTAIEEPSRLPIGSLNIAYSPFKNFNGYDSLKVRAKDLNMISGISTITIQVLFVNQPPEIVQKEITHDLDKNGKVTEIRILGTDIDEKNWLSLVIENTANRGLWYLNADASLPVQLRQGTIVRSVSIAQEQSLNATMPVLLYVKADDLGGILNYAEFKYHFLDSSGNRSLDSGSLKIQVRCPFNQYVNIWSTGTPCKPCPLGAKCSDMAAHLPLNQKGFFPSTNFNFVPCIPIDACPESVEGADSGSFSFDCKEGYAGDRCGLCSKGYYRNAQYCVACPNVAINPFVIALIAVVLVIFVLAFINIIRQVDLGFIGILIGFWQIVAIFQTFPLRWPAPVARMFHYFSFLYFNIELVSPECFLETDVSVMYELKWFGTLALPFFTLLVIVLILLLRTLYDLAYSKLKTMFFKRSKKSPNYTSVIQKTAPLESESEPPLARSSISLTNTTITTTLSFDNPFDDQSATSSQGLTVRAKSLTCKTTGADSAMRRPSIQTQSYRRFSQLNSTRRRPPTYLLNEARKGSVDYSSVDNTLSEKSRLTFDLSKETDSEIRTDEETLGGGAVPFFVTLSMNMLSVLKLVYINVAQRSLELFDCSYNDVINYYIYHPETSRKCFEDWWFRLLPVAIMGIAVYVIGIPLLFLFLFYKRRKYVLIPKSSRTKWEKFIVQVTYNKNSEFKESTRYWDTVLMIRQLAIVSCRLFFTGFTVFQSVVVNMVFLVFLYPQMAITPYAVATVNRLEAVSIMSSILVLMCGQLFYIQEFKSDLELNILGYMVIVIILSVSVLILGALLAHLRQLYLTYRKNKMNKK